MKFKITKKENLPESVVVIEGELTAQALEDEKKPALEKFQHMFTIDGFRKGHIPEKILIDRVGELGLIEEEGSLALERAFRDIIIEASISPIGQPKVSITKIASGQPMGFKIETAIAPEVTLSNYKKISKEVMSKAGEASVVTDKEIEDALQDIRRSVAHQKFHEKHSDTNDHNHNIKEEDLPEVTNEFVASLGDFTSVEDFKSKLQSNLLNEKQVKVREKKRLEVIEGIIKDAKVEVPEVLIKSELSKMVGQFKDSVSTMGITYEEYLNKVNKTEELLKEEWRDEAKKRAIIQLVLNKIAVEEKIKADEFEIKDQVGKLLTYYKEADPLTMQMYVETMMTNEKVWKFLEDQK